MLIPYRGLGFIPIAFLFLCGVVTLILGVDIHDCSGEGAALMAAGIFTGVACIVLKVQNSRVGNGQLKLMSTQHTFIFIPVVFWCPILIVMGLYKL